MSVWSNEQRCMHWINEAILALSIDDITLCMVNLNRAIVALDRVAD